MAAESGSYREAVRWGLLLAAVAVSGWRLPGIVRDYRNWRMALPIDPSAADLYKTNLEVGVIGIAVVLLISAGVFFLLKPREKS